MGSTLIVESDDGLLSNVTSDIVSNRKGTVIALHLFAFSGTGELLLNLSEGDFTPDEWDDACTQAEDRAQSVNENDEDDMVVDDSLKQTAVRSFLLDSMKSNIR